MKDIAELTDNQLFNELKGHGYNIGPVTTTTRSCLERKLLKHFETGVVPSGQDNKSKSTLEDALYERFLVQISKNADKSKSTRTDFDDDDDDDEDALYERFLVVAKNADKSKSTFTDFDDDDDDDDDLRRLR
jgi:hypothetical protein